MPIRRKPESAWQALLCLAVSLVGLPSLFWSLYQTAIQANWLLLPLLIAAVASGLFPVKLPRTGKKGVALVTTASDIVVFGGLFLVSPAAAAVLACLDSLIGNRLTKSWYRLYLNLALSAGVTFLSGVLFYQLMGVSAPLVGREFSLWSFWASFVAAASVYYLAATIVISLAASLSLDKPWFEIFKSNCLASSLINFATAFSSAAIFLSLTRGGLHSLIVAVPVIAVTYYSYRVNRQRIESLQRSQAFLKSTMNSLSSAVAILDGQGDIVAANETWVSHVGTLFGSGHPIGSNYLAHIENLEGESRAAGRLISSAIRTLVDRPERAVRREYSVILEGGARWYSLNVTSFDQETELRVVVAHEDITDVRLAERRIIRLAYHDELTGLPNRTFAAECLDAMIHADGSLSKTALLAFDLDRFDRINSSFGHEQGDQVLLQFAEILREAAPRCSQTLGLTPYEHLGTSECQNFVARVDGDEFIAVLANLEEESAVDRLVEQVRARLRRPILLDGKEVFVSASVGVALTPQDSRNGELLLQRAETALHNAKKRGKNTCCYYSQRFSVLSAEYVSMETKIRTALRDGHFFLLYQPRALTATCERVGAEALLRMADPEEGVVSPMRFIPVAEDSGLIIPLTEWVLEQAARQAKQWHRTFRRTMISVNISALHLTSGKLVEAVERVLRKTGLPASLLELELTESTLMHDLQFCIDTIRRLKELGVSVALDDFGTGFSSLSWLSRLPIDTVKIDRSFLANLDANSGVIKAIVAVARELGLNVVGEGVETQQQLEFLKEVGCREIQGFYLSPPVPPEELASSTDVPLAANSNFKGIQLVS